MNNRNGVDGVELNELSDNELLIRLEVMSVSEKKLGADIVRHLVEVENLALE